MYRGRASDTLTIRKNNLLKFQCERERRIFGNFFSVEGASAIAFSSSITFFKQSRKTPQWFSSNTLNNSDIKRYRHNQQILPRKSPLPKRMRTQSYSRKNRLFSTTTKEFRKTGRHTRKKKPLLPSPNKKLTTKDRLRMPSRPSSSAINSRQNKSGVDYERMMIKSPEELMERLNSGLDIARTVVQEGYASLRNPTVATSSGRNAGNKHNNHLLSARPEHVGINEGTKPIGENGLVMDANWWFWNLLFAASPSVVIALYCQFIVQPEMKIRNEQREKDAASEENESTSSSADDKFGDGEIRDNTENNMSPMRKRQEQQKHHQQQSLDDTARKNSSSSPPLNSSNSLNDVLSAYTRSLVSWFSEEQSVLTPASEHGRSHENRTDEVEESSTKIYPNTNQEQRKKEIMSLEIQQQELKVLQLQLQMLEDKISSQQQHRATSNTDSDDSDDNDVASENSVKRESLLSLLPKLIKYNPAVGINIGREHWVSLLHWWKNCGYYRQPSDENNCGGIDIGDGNGKCEGNGNVKENI